MDLRCVLKRYFSHLLDRGASSSAEGHRTQQKAVQGAQLLLGSGEYIVRRKCTG